MSMKVREQTIFLILTKCWLFCAQCKILAGLGTILVCCCFYAIVMLLLSLSLYDCFYTAIVVFVVI